MQKTPSVSMFGLAIVLVAIFVGAVLFSKTEKVSSGEVVVVSEEKIKTISLDDGTYTVRIDAVNQSVENTVIVMREVIYFEGAEARIAAVKEVDCKGVIEECVPTLLKDYYVRETNNAPFEVPVPADKAALATMVLDTIQQDPDTVFIVTFRNGNLLLAEQKIN